MFYPVFTLIACLGGACYGAFFWLIRPLKRRQHTSTERTGALIALIAAITCTVTVLSTAQEL